MISGYDENRGSALLRQSFDADFGLADIAAVSDDEIFADDRINQLKNQSKLHIYLRMLAEAVIEKEGGVQYPLRLSRVFATSIKHIKQGQFTHEQSKELLACLDMAVAYLPQDVLDVIIDKIFNSFKPESSAHAQEGHAKVLELLPYLVSASKMFPTRMTTIDRICNLKWDNASSLMLAAALSDICETEEHCIAAVSKISSLTSWETVSDCRVQLEDIPGLLYNLTVIGGKLPSAADLKLRILNVIADSIDSLANQLDSRPRAGGDSARALLPHNTKLNISNILGTIICHLTLLISKDRELASVMLGWIRARSLFRVSPTTHCPSVARLVLCLIAASSTHTENTFLHGIRDYIALIVTVEQRASRSLWFQKLTWENVLGVSFSQLQEGFSAIITGPFLQTGLVQALVSLALQLLEFTRNASPKSPWSSLTASAIHCQLSPLTTYSVMTSSVDGFGEWILVNIFQQCEYTRESIIKEVVLRLMLASSGGRHNSNLPILLKILHTLVTDCPHLLLEHEHALHDIFTSLGELDSAAGSVIHAVSPMFRMSPSLLDRCVLSIRKITFSNDASHRMAAVSILIELLDFQLLHGHTASLGLPTDEILLLLKRFLQHQACVRSLLYEKLLQLCHSYASVRIISLRLLLNQINAYLIAGSDIYSAVPVQSQSHSRGHTSAAVVNFRLCLDHRGAVTEPIHELLLTLTIMTCSLANSNESEEEEQVGCSQRSYSAATCHEVRSALTLLLQISNALVDKGLDEFDLQSIQCVEDYHRGQLFADTAHVCMFIAVMLPVGGAVTLGLEGRKTLLSTLADRRGKVIQSLEKFKRASDIERKKSKKQLNETELEDSVDVIRGDGLAPVVRSKGSLGALSNTRIHEFILHAFRTCVSPLEDGLTFVSDPIVSDVLFPTFLAQLETILSYCQQTLERRMYDTARSHRAFAEFCTSASTLCNDIQPCLWRGISQLKQALDDDLTEKQRVDSVLTIEKLSRCVLGCIRLELAAVTVTISSPIERCANLSEVLARSFDEILGVDTSVSSLRGPTTLLTSLKKIQDLFLSVASEDALADIRKGHCPVLLVAIMSELVVFLDNPARKAFASHFINKCKLTSKDFPTMLTQSIVEFLAYVCPVTPPERFDRSKDIAKMIDEAKCIDDTDRIQLPASLENAREILIAALDKACMDTEFLLKIKAHKKTHAVKKGLVPAEDHLSGDEDEGEAINKAADKDIPILCISVNKILLAIKHLFFYVDASPNNERILLLLGKVYKLIVLICKSLHASRVAWIPDTFRFLLEALSTDIAPPIESFIVRIHNEVKTSKAQKQSRSAKSVPALIYQMEQLDVQVMKLSKVLTDPSAVTKFIQKTKLRDFKICDGAEEVDEEQEKGKCGGKKGKRRRGKENEAVLGDGNGSDDDEGDTY